MSWNAALFNGILTLDSESSGATPLTDQGTIADTATLLDSSGTLQPIHAEQVTDETVDWLNIFYALEWLVFAGFALTSGTACSRTRSKDHRPHPLLRVRGRILGR